MRSKTYFIIAGIFIGLYLATTLGVLVGMPDWVHQVCTAIFGVATFLGIRAKKKEQGTG